MEGLTITAGQAMLGLIGGLCVWGARGIAPRRGGVGAGLRSSGGMGSADLAVGVRAARAAAPRPPLRCALYTLRTRHRRPRPCQVPSAARFGGGLQGLLVGADCCQGVGVEDVGYR